MSICIQKEEVDIDEMLWILILLAISVIYVQVCWLFGHFGHLDIQGNWTSARYDCWMCSCDTMSCGYFGSTLL